MSKLNEYLEYPFNDNDLKTTHANGKIPLSSFNDLIDELSKITNLIFISFNQYLTREKIEKNDSNSVAKFEQYLYLQLSKEGGAMAKKPTLIRVPT